MYDSRQRKICNLPANLRQCEQTSVRAFLGAGLNAQAITSQSHPYDAAFCSKLPAIYWRCRQRRQPGEAAPRQLWGQGRQRRQAAAR